MANARRRLASCILREQFGDIIEKTADYLIRKGSKSVRDIAEGTKEDKNEIKKSICILIQHGLVSYETNGPHTTYKVIEENVLLRIRHPRFIYTAKLKFGDIGELILEELLANGCEIISHVVEKVIEKPIPDDKGNQVKPSLNATVHKFIEMVQAHVIKRVKPPPSPEGKTGAEEISNDFLVPSHLVQDLGRKKKVAKKGSDEPPQKKLKSDESAIKEVEASSETYVDEGIYWYVNFEKLHQLILDDMIVATIGENLNQAAARMVETMLTKSGEDRDTLCKATKTLASFEILRKMPSVPHLTQYEVSQYLSILSDEMTCGFLQKSDETGGGMFCVNLHKSVERLCQTTIESIVQERFGALSSRIFRLLYFKKCLEQKQIGELAMIPFRQCKELLYKLFQENYLKLFEVSRAGDFAPSRAFYLFGLDLPQVARFVIRNCYQTLGNLITRREKDLADNKRLLDKNEKIEAVLATIGASEENTEVTQELEELITPVEKEQLEKLKIALTRIEHGEVQVDETIFILQLYLSFN